MYEFAITCDGGSRNNQVAKLREGYGSWMIAAPHKTNKIRHREFGKGVTNNEAEYMALIGALEEISDAFTAVAADLKTIKLIVRTDSQLVIGHLTKDWKIKSELVPLVVKAKSLCQAFHSVAFEKIHEKDMKRILGH